MPDTRPHPLGDENRHYWLALSMAKATGTDLQAALDAGRISHADWADLVTRCRGCAWVEGCDCWLAKQTTGEPAAPISCVNAAFFKQVRDGEV